METKPSADTPDPGAKAPATFKYTFSGSVAQILAQSGASLWVSTYQVGKLAVFRVNPEGKLSLLLRTFDKAMGMALTSKKLAIGTRHQIWSLNNEASLAPRIEPRNSWDACYLPRSSHVTGDIDIHELAWGGVDAGELWFVNTLYSALCTLSPDSSFVPRWQPPFINELRKHDRCHLNGLAMVDGAPAYVTAFAETNSPSGWRHGNHKREGGVVIDVASGATVSRGLSMPHSPRYYAGRLWVLDSGNGRLATVDPRDGSRETVAELPGYTRGLTFMGRHAFVGLSRIRETAIFGGIPIAEKPADRKCGIWIVDIITGEISGSIEFHETVDEVFDVQVVQGIASPFIVGLEKDPINKHCIIGPPERFGKAIGLEEVSNPTRPGSSGLSVEEGLRLDAQAQQLRARISREPGNPKLLNQLGNLLYREGRLDAAIQSFRRAVEIAPDYAPSHRNLGSLLAESGDPRAAVASARKALELEPDHAVSLNNLGYALRAAESLTESSDALEAAVRNDPDYARAWLNLSQTRRELGDRSGAVLACRKARDLDPDSVDTLLKLGNALREDDRLEEAVAIFERILEIAPGAIDARHDLGLVRQKLGDLTAAREDFEAVLAARPMAIEARRNLALITLMQGDFENGWDLHECRLIRKPVRRPLPCSPQWDGQPFERDKDKAKDKGATLLLHTEQGFGDLMQFVRFASLAREKSAAEHVIFACKERIMPLFADVEGIDEVVPAEQDLPRHTAHASLMSLPFLCRTGAELLADRVPYLKARPDLVASLHERSTDGIPWIDESATRVVIAWQGDPTYPGDSARSIPLTAFAPLAAVKDVRLVSVQRSPGSGQIADAGVAPLLAIGDEIDVDCGAFEETAALLSTARLVITSDTSLAHLAGALGVSVWVALAKVPDWRWGLEGDSSPWYPTMKLYRQQVAGDWEPVFRKMAGDLAALAAQD